MYQFEKPAKDAEVIVMKTSMGTIKLRLFPEKAPKTVENFVTHAKEGYYDGLCTCCLSDQVSGTTMV